MSEVEVYPELVTVEPGTKLVGEFARLERGSFVDGSGNVVKRPIAIIKIDGVDRSLWLHEKALRGQFAEKRPEPGENIVVIKGSQKKVSASGFGYWPFSLELPDRPGEGAPDWDDPLFGDDPPGRADDEFGY
jgi:hypothetical protein